MATMNERERVYNILEGKTVDRAPTGFWLHFPESMHHGDAAIKAHLEFMRQTGTDILKVMNENLLYDGESKICSTADISKFRGYSRKDKIFIDQMDIIKRISDQTQGRYPILATLHGLIASVFHGTGFGGNYTGMGYGLSIFCREKPKEMQKVFEIYTDTLMELADCSLEAGADGIFYAALGGERNWFFHDEYMEQVSVHEQRLYDHIKEKTKFNVLHICKSNIDFERFTVLEPAVVNWSIYHNNLSLTEGGKLFPNSIVLGGFQDRSGVLVDGTEEEIEAHTRKILKEMEGKPFIVGSDCTLPTEISPERIRCAVRAVENAYRE
ncbi:MAG: uroporphyrinogen decarboxylase family protein [Enterocloster sp.]